MQSGTTKNNRQYVIFNGGKYYSMQSGHMSRRRPTKSLHQAIYEEYYKIEVPKGFLIHHIDKNPRNNSISNLLLVSKSEHGVIHATGGKIWLGRKHTEETKSKISKAHLGKIVSEETKNKMRKPKSKEHKNKLRIIRINYHIDKRYIKNLNI